MEVEDHTVLRRRQEPEEGAVGVTVAADVTVHGPVPQAVAIRVFDPCHGGTGVAQELGAIGAREVIGEVEDTQPLEAGKRATRHGALGDARSAVAVACAHA